MHTRAREDPAAAGGCAQCGKPRGRTIPKAASRRARASLAAMLAADPFCSSPCARKWHRVDYADDEQTKAPAHDLEWTT